MPFDGCFRDMSFDTLFRKSIHIIYSHNLGNSVSAPQKPSSKIGQSVDLIKCVLKSSNYGLHDECIHKKLEECEYTYIHCTTTC